MPRVVHFEIAADDPNRAAEFYEKVFGWEIEEWEESKGPEYWLVTTGPDKTPGINGGIFRREKPLSGTDGLIGYRCTIDVPAIDEFIDKVAANGGQIVKPKMPVTGVGWLAFCKDTEGNGFGMMQGDMSAK